MTQEIAQHNALAEAVSSRFGELVLEIDKSFDDLTIVAEKTSVHDLLAYLKNEKQFDLLLDVAGVDCLQLAQPRERFEIEYILYSVVNNHRVRVCVAVPEDDLDVATVTDLWESANWAEREAFEMYGFNFVGHPCLKRLLTHHEFKGNPLRKDYPVTQGQWCATTSDLTDELNE
jgi:NADH/F420H2 dehydrogenase subunit C